MKLEFRIAISPFPAFYSTVKLAALSLRRLGPPYDSARVVVSVGDLADLKAIRAANPWSEDFPVVWRSVVPWMFRNYSYFATHSDRYFEPTDADVIFICDGDVCLVDRVDELAARLAQPGRRAVAGLQAHFPAIEQDAAGSEARWRRIFAESGLGEPRLAYSYSGDVEDQMGLGPAYFNYGFVGFSREAFMAVAPLQTSYSMMVAALTDKSFYLAQISLALMIHQTGLEVEQLSFAYNCCNDTLPFTAAAPLRLAGPDEIRVIHFLRNDQVDRRKFLADPVAFDAFLAASDLNAVNARLRDHVLALGGRANLLFV